MDIIYSLLKSLNPVETEVLSKYIRIFSKNNEVEIKTIKLIELTLKHGEECLDDSFYCRKIYKKAKDDRFVMLKVRVKNKVLDSLHLDVNLERRNAWDDVTVWSAKIKKKLASIDLLIHKGEVKIIYKLLIDVIEISKEYELFPELVEALYKYKWIKSLREGRDEFNKIHSEIEFYELCSKKATFVKDKYSQLLMLTSFTVNPDKSEIEKFLLHTIKESTDALGKTNSLTIKYYLKLFEFAYFNLIEDHNMAKDKCHEVIDLVTEKESKPIKMRRRIGIAYDHLCGCAMKQSNFKEAISFARNAQEYFSISSINHAISREYEFYSMFYEGDYSGAESISSTFKKYSAKIEKGSFIPAKYEFLHTNVLFKLGKYREVLQKLGKIEEIVKDKSGWNLGVRLLTIMSLIELGRIDQAISGIESMRKHIERSSKDLTIRDRDRTIVKLLQYMHKEGFVFNNFHKNDQLINALRSLKSKSKEMRWEVLSHELIPFHDWVESKMRVKLPVAAGTEISVENIFQ